MKFADIHNELSSLFDTCYDKFDFSENLSQTYFYSNWTCLEQSGVGAGLGCHIRKSD